MQPEDEEGGLLHYSAFSLETAACLWEAVLTLRDRPVSARGDIGLAIDVRSAFEALGTAALRLTVVDWTRAVETAWRDEGDDYPDCFDWDFVPAWIVDHVDWSDPFAPVLKERGEG